MAAKKKAPATAATDSLPLPFPEPRPTASPELEQKIREFQFYDNRVAELEQELGDLKARRKYVGEHEMVELVEPELVASGVRLSDGTEWTFHQEYECGIRSDDKPEAFEYLRAHDAGGMLKTKLVLSFGKDTSAQVAAVKAVVARLLPQYEVSVRAGKAPETLPTALAMLLEAAGVMTPTIAVEQYNELPGATLRAWVIKQLKLGQSLPACFGVYAPLRARQVMPNVPMTEEDEANTAGPS